MTLYYIFTEKIQIILGQNRNNSDYSMPITKEVSAGTEAPSLLDYISLSNIEHIPHCKNNIGECIYELIIVQFHISHIYCQVKKVE